VTWADAENYAKWVGGRLPTEAEWEYAARGPDSERYPWGARFDGTKLNYCDANCTAASDDEKTDYGHAQSAPVGSYPRGASWCGALDMAGNVWEWVHDWYDPGYYNAYPSDNPQGPLSDTLRVQRGGSYLTPERNLHCAFRGYQTPQRRLSDLGFRVVVPAE
jgi:formylglycine-generating enzyme required for sulfatase activity